MNLPFMKQLPTRWSLSTLILGITILAISASHLRVSWLLSDSRRQVAWLESRREMVAWPDPEAVNVLLLSPQLNGLDLEARQGHWEWKLQIPDNKAYRLRWDASTSLPPLGTSSVTESRPASDAILLSGQSELSVTVREADGQRLLVSWSNSASTKSNAALTTIKQQHLEDHQQTIADSCGLFTFRGFSQKRSGLNSIFQSSADSPVELLSIQPGDKSGATAPGFRIWIEPVENPAAGQN